MSSLLQRYRDTVLAARENAAQGRRVRAAQLWREARVAVLEEVPNGRSRS
jgi:hypothetical protein